MRRAGQAARAVLAIALLGGLVVALPLPVAAAPEPPAFPGAVGFGAGATGGRGGEVVIVDTLEPFGPGSLGEALAPAECGPRIVVFRVSGVIEVPGDHDLELTCGDLTVAGQTAPGAGITVAGRIDGYGADPAGNIILRHLRLRPPPITDEEGAVDDLGLRYDALQLSNNPLVMLDHLSLSWGTDETLDLYEGSGDITVQWSTIEQSNPAGLGADGPHNDGMIAGPDSPRVTLDHVLFAHHEARCPALATGPAELLNSVVYDCQDAFVHHNPAEGEFHVAATTFVHGPSHDPFTPLFFDDEEPGDTTYWISDVVVREADGTEVVLGDLAGSAYGEAAFVGADPSQVLEAPSDFAEESEHRAPVPLSSAAVAEADVLAGAGALPRDEMTTETAADVRNGTGDWIPDPPEDLIAGLTPTEAPTDDDADGMADAWEAERGVDDPAEVLPSGYTAIEEHVNELADALMAETGVVPASSGPADDSTGDGDGTAWARWGALAAAIVVALVVVGAVGAVVAVRRRPDRRT